MKQLIGHAIGIGAGLLLVHSCNHNNATSRAKAFAQDMCQIMHTQNKTPEEAMLAMLARDGTDNPKWKYNKRYKTPAAQALRDEFLKCSGFDLTSNLKQAGYL